MDTLKILMEIAANVSIHAVNVLTPLLVPLANIQIHLLENYLIVSVFAKKGFTSIRLPIYVHLVYLAAKSVEKN